MIWVCVVISNHIPPGHTHYPSNCPTQSHAHRLLMCLYSQSVPTELQEQLLSLPYWIQVYCPQQVSQSEDEQLCKFPRNGVTHIQKCACRQSNIFYSPLLYCHVGSFCKSAAPSKLGAHMAATNGNRAGWCGFWWNNGCGLLRSDWISFQIPIYASS